MTPALADLKGFKLGYAVARTKAKLKPEIEALDEALKPDAAFRKYEEKRMELCRKHAQKDTNGSPMVQGNEFFFGDSRAAFDAEMVLLQEEFTGAIEDRKRQIEDYNISMLENISVEIYPVAEADVPADASVRQVEVLILFME